MFDRNGVSIKMKEVKEKIMSKSFVIGISGSIGSGKSLIRHLLALRGVLTVDADELTHFLLAEDKSGYRAALQLFGDQILTKDSRIDRGRLGKIVFNDPQQLRILEDAIHPLVGEVFRTMLDNTACPLVAVEAIKLYESDLIRVVNSRWFVNSRVNSQIARLKTTRGMTHHQIADRLEKQAFPKDMKIDYYIENSRHITDAWEQVERVWCALMTGSVFRSAQKALQKKNPMFILDLPQIKDLHPDAQVPIFQILHDEKGKNLEQLVLKSRVFLSPLDQGKTYFLWRFDHFNTVIKGISNPCEEDVFLSGLEKLEELTRFWNGNCLVVPLKKEHADLKNELILRGYREFHSFDQKSYPYLLFDPLIEGTIETHLVKPLPGGIWRLIP
jgi:dephospho-CoA kinase